ncbi:hypothetical protein ACLOJK_000222 [Asimina triloba]
MRWGGGRIGGERETKKREKGRFALFAPLEGEEGLQVLISKTASSLPSSSQ